MWPESYSLLWGLDGFKVELPAYLKWMDAKSIPEEFAVKTAYALRDWWTGATKAQKRKNPYFTFQNWCVKDKDRQGSRRPSDPRDVDDLKEGWGNAKPR